MKNPRKPTRSIARIRRQIDRARRERVMVVLHPDTVEWLALLAAARTNCVLEPKEAKTLLRLLKVLQEELDVVIRSNFIPKQKQQPKEVVRAQRDFEAAWDLIKTLTGAKP